MVASMVISNLYNKAQIEIDQFLHGYSQGHRLLESSISLPKELQTILLIMSDMSGPNMVKGFETYITGYPLGDSDYYSVAKTWYASEMKRPGCVWTHTLIIKKADLSVIEDLSRISELFSHPDTEHSYLKYSEQLTLGRDNPKYNLADSEIDSSGSIHMALQVLTALYQMPDRPVYISSNASSKYQQLILKIWAQQWASLQASFLFCTGSIANRTLSGQTFDLQVVPNDRIRQIRRDAPTGILLGDIVNISQVEVSDDQPALTAIAQSFFDSSQHGSTLQNIFRIVDDEDLGNRREFFRLLEVGRAIEIVKREGLFLSNLVATIADKYPEAHTAKNLKKRLFGRPSGESTLFPIAQEYDILKELAMTSFPSAFDSASLEIAQRAADLWDADKERSIDLIASILRGDLNLLAQEIVRGVAEKVIVDDLFDLYPRVPGLVQIILSLRPEIAATPQIWDQKMISKEVIIESLSRAKILSDDTIYSIIQSALDCFARNTAEYMVRFFKDKAVKAFLVWHNHLCAATVVDHDQLYFLISEWQANIFRYPEGIIDWLRGSNDKNPQTLLLISSLLDPNNAEVVKIGATVWQPLTDIQLHFKDRSERLRLKCFLFVLALNHRDRGAACLVSFSFEDIHDALARDELGYNNWELIESHLPDLSWWVNWDKCERIRRALVATFIEYKWPTQAFLDSVNTKDNFQRLIDSCMRHPEGEAFLRRIVSEINAGSIRASQIQQKIVFRRFARNK